MTKTLSKLSNLFYFLLFVPIAIGLALFVFDFHVINIFSLNADKMKIITIIINSVGILSIKLIEKHFKSIKRENFGFDKKLSIYRAKMLSGIAVIYLLEMVNVLAYLIAGDKIILIIYFLMVLLILVYLPSGKKIAML